MYWLRKRRVDTVVCRYQCIWNKDLVTHITATTIERGMTVRITEATMSHLIHRNSPTIVPIPIFGRRITMVHITTGIRIGTLLVAIHTDLLDIHVDITIAMGVAVLKEPNTTGTLVPVAVPPVQDTAVSLMEIVGKYTTIAKRSPRHAIRWDPFQPITLTRMRMAALAI